MVGILVEKGSAKLNFAKALGGERGKYNGEDYIIASASGHLYEYLKPEFQVPPNLAPLYKSWDVANLPWDESVIKWKRTPKPKAEPILEKIKSILSMCDEIVIATDIDPTGEGELLAWEIIDELGLPTSNISRMYFIDESKKSIQTAFVKRKRIPSMKADPDYRKAEYRAKFDYLTMQFTRIATSFSGRDTNGKSINLRQGRLKSAMVLLVGDALKKLESYKRVPYYQNRFKDENGNVFTNLDEPQFPDKASVPNSYKTSSVTVDKKEMRRSPPPKLLDLATLSSILAKRGIKAKTVLSTYQRMYENQVVSYPRTEDKYITPEQFNELLPKIDQIADVVGVDKSLLTRRTPRTTHVKVGGAHGANRPGSNVPKSLDDLSVFGEGARDIYELLARNYLATLAEDYEYESQSAHVTDYPAFVSKIAVPMKAGYKKVFDIPSDDDDADASVRAFGKTAECFIYEGFPPKPPTPTMKWLMTQLERYDVGTGATRTSIYAEVTDERYPYPLLIEHKGKLSMSHYGEISYMLLPNTNIGNIKLTEHLMADMRGVADGSVDANESLFKVRNLVVEDLEQMKVNSLKLKELGLVKEAPEKVKGIWAVTGEEVSFKKVWGGHTFTDEEVQKLLAGEEIEILGLKSKTGSTYGITGKLERQEYNGHPYVGFLRTGFANSGGGSGSSDGVPMMWCKHRFTDAEKAKLEAGESIFIDDFVSKKTGKTFAATIHYGKTDDGRMAIIPEF